MSVKAIQIAVFPPTGELEPGRGFYQTEEDSLYVQVGNYHSDSHFFSFLESEWVRFDFDKFGRLLFFEVSLPRHRWLVSPDWHPPAEAERADIRWLDFRETIPTPDILTNHDRNGLELRLEKHPPERFFLLAEHILLGVTAQQTVSRIWLTDIVEDRAGHEIAAFRRLTAIQASPPPAPVK